MQNKTQQNRTDENWLEFWVAFEGAECLATKITVTHTLMLYSDSDSKRCWLSHKLFALRIDIIQSDDKNKHVCINPQARNVCAMR